MQVACACRVPVVGGRRTQLGVQSHVETSHGHASRARVVLRAQRVREAVAQLTRSKQGKAAGGGGSPDEEEGGEEVKWGLFDWSQYNQGFDVPWGFGTTSVGFLTWLAAFLATGLAGVPVLWRAAGQPPISSLTPDEKSIFLLVNQIAEVAVGIAVIRAVTGLATGWKKPGEDGGPDESFLRIDLRGPFRKPDGWLFWGMLGTAVSPAVLTLSATLSQVTGYQAAQGGGRGTADEVANILATPNGLELGSLLVVTAVLAPALEEIVFRGFLLTSLTRVMRPWQAVVASSGAFALAHLSTKDLPQLFALGLVLGFSYVRSRNLMAPMVIHGAWNGSVLIILAALAASGVDLDSLLADQG
ncbi:unnamed protein product [Pedinophyceae sp. YPF-701]|nr:unnamed protein product [Pedinophyceae sp. YPF-701]